MKFKTLKAKEEYLNELYLECYSSEAAFDSLIYLTSKRRAKRTTESNLRAKIESGKVGTLLRRLDPIAFNCA